jgi:hypothetical protein
LVLFTLFFTGENLPKSKIQNSKIHKKEVVLEVSGHQKWGGKKGKIFQTHIFDFHCAAKNIEGWLKISTLFLIYSQIWLNLHRMIATFSTYSYGWSPLWLQTKNFLKNTSALCLGHSL